jgi:gliding motility-associated-like protein
VETSEFGCVSDTVRFNFLQDRTRLNLRYVTTQVENDKNMQIVWSLLEGTNYNNPISLQKWVNSTWQTIQNGANSDTVFIDANLNTENQIYTYRLQGVNRCGVSINSAAHSSILLSGTANNADNSVRLNWTSYQGWNGTNSILRNNDNRGFTLLQNVSIDTTFTAPIGKDGFNQCFRVLARETNGTGLSYSNIVCLDYENQLIIPNIITPNNDAKNETWDMDNRQLYQVEVEIYNRWGKKLYNNSNYQGDWKADNLPSGIYFYRIKYTAKGMTYEKNGYLNVVR